MHLYHCYLYAETEETHARTGKKLKKSVPRGLAQRVFRTCRANSADEAAQWFLGVIGECPQDRYHHTEREVPGSRMIHVVKLSPTYKYKEHPPTISKVRE
jgi:hypothetical protein